MQGKTKLTQWLFRIAIALCLIVFVFSATMFIRDVYRGEKEKAANRELQEQLRQTELTMPEKGESSNGMLPQYEELWRQNNDLAGWLSIEDTPINYPVMYTPENPEYYLRRAFDHSKAVSGSLFIDGSCTLDGNHFLIYGHHMKNGTMFGTLSEYADKDYAQKHPDIHFDTLYDQGVYEVMAAFYSRAYTEEDTNVFRYYQYTDLSDPDTFAEYVREVKDASLYDTGIDANYGDTLLTLSTCDRHVEDGRFVVVARKTP